MARKTITVKSLQDRLLRYRMTRRQAQAKLKEIQDLFRCLATCQSDSKRIEIFYKIQERFSGYGSLEDLVYWSALANPTPATLRGKKQIRDNEIAEKAQSKKWQEDLSIILQQGTGITLRLARAITRTRSFGKSYNPKWPIQVFKATTIPFFVINVIVTGPKGSMPLEGEGAPWRILEDREKNAKRS